MMGGGKERGTGEGEREFFSIICILKGIECMNRPKYRIIFTWCLGNLFMLYIYNIFTYKFDFKLGKNFSSHTLFAYVSE
jgi:hypothetical protein